MEICGRVSTLGHTPDNMADNLPFSLPACSRQGRRPSRSRISQRPPKTNGWGETHDTEGNPMGLRLYIVKGPSTLRVSLILLHTMHTRFVIRVGVRTHTCAPQFSILVILFVFETDCMCGMHMEIFLD